ncbi:ribonuclease H-like domain-containing protein [Mycena galericulata]|nr:ribonuclease H-like domain-containing protein [Mycena galericulata]
MGNDKGPLWAYFHSRPGTNSKHVRACCRQCVDHTLKNPPPQWGETVLPSGAKSDPIRWSINGVASSMAAHILGYPGHPACPHASQKATSEATKSQVAAKARKEAGSDSMPVTGTRSHATANGDAAASSSSSAVPPPATLSKKPKQGHFQVISRKKSTYEPDEQATIEPSNTRNYLYRRSIWDFRERGDAGIIRRNPRGVLNACADEVENELKRVLSGQEIGLSADGWKAQSKASVNGVCGNVNNKAYPLKLIDATALPKDSPVVCLLPVLSNLLLWMYVPQFQLTLGDYFKSWELVRQIAEQATSIISWINNHSKVHVIFDAAQNELGRAVALAYLVACITRWTTHFTAFARLQDLRGPITKAVAWKRPAIIAAQVGAAQSTEAARLEADAKYHCDIIDDPHFWNGLEQVLGDIEVICYAMNLSQKDSTRADQALLALVGIFLRFNEHPEEEVKTGMLQRLEKRWSSYDQMLFLLTLILNPWEEVSCFGHNANLDHFKIIDLAVQMYRRLALRPNFNGSTDAEKKVSKAMGDYLAGVGCFQAWDEHRKSGDIITIDEEKDPMAFWKGFLKTEARELALMSITLFGIIVNQAGVERVFSFLKETTKDRRNRLGLAKTEKVLKPVTLHKDRKVRQNHKAVEKLLQVPRYANLLQDQADEDPSERGRALVSSPDGWRVEMARWIVDAQEAAAAEDAEEEEEGKETPEQAGPVRRPRKWRPMTLKKLFGTSPRKEDLRTRISRRARDQEEMYMRVMAELDEADDSPDNGAIEIDDDEVYGD